MKVIAEYKYDFTGGKIYRYLSQNKYYSTYSFDINSLDKSVEISVFYSDINDKKNYFQNWLIYDSSNQITFTGITDGGIDGRTSASISNFGVRSVLGDKWKGAKTVRVNFENTIRIITILG